MSRGYKKCERCLEVKRSDKMNTWTLQHGEEDMNMTWKVTYCKHCTAVIEQRSRG